jgi:hypothetical protein
METFHAKCKIENPTARSRSVVIPKLLVDTASEFTWVPERMLERIRIRREEMLNLRAKEAKGAPVKLHEPYVEA